MPPIMIDVLPDESDPMDRQKDLAGLPSTSKPQIVRWETVYTPPLQALRARSLVGRSPR